MFAIALVPVVLGLLVGFGGFLGFRERLTREGGTGVRTEAALRSEEAFKLANRVAGLPTMAGGAIAVLTGLAGLAMPTTGGLVSAALAGVLAMLVLVMGGGVLGNRAALTVPAPAPAAPAGCSGCACGAGGCGVFKKDDA
ncbi:MULTISPECIES: SdpI family protein [unclassified Amycolatopsis]|uniref:SdpI family protein n=1 Tax=unclassified Amycolatopsis TaxID=2618356 RepID=UPI0028770725|nr:MULTISPECIES: SdpI family protein [unclassified Amycolatopsis]MDS0133109.1 SdpI family protein [Amycolatopsis sp. 505]MDS0142066.1 SdpI family protein [Amycolatopsis sp. CM201R]